MNIILEMGGLTKKTTIFGFIFTLWNCIDIFYKTTIVWFRALTTEWPYPRKHLQILIKLNFINIYTSGKLLFTNFGFISQGDKNCLLIHRIKKKKKENVFCWVFSCSSWVKWRLNLPEILSVELKLLMALYYCYYANCLILGWWGSQL